MDDRRSRKEEGERKRSVSKSHSPVRTWIVRDTKGKEQEYIRSVKKNKKELNDVWCEEDDKIQSERDIIKKKWKEEDSKKESERQKELSKLNKEEVEMLKSKSVEEEVLFQSKSFSDNEVYVLYLASMIETAMKNNDENLTNTLKVHIIDNIDRYKQYLFRHSISRSLIVFSVKLFPDYGKIDFLGDIEYSRHKKALSSIIDEVLKQGITTVENWIKQLVSHTSNSNADFHVLKKLIYGYGSLEIRQKLEEIYDDHNMHITSDVEKIIRDYISLEVEHL